MTIISAYGSEERKAEVMQKGAYGFIDKPFTERDILKCIRRLHKGSQHKEVMPSSYEGETIAGLNAVIPVQTGIQFRSGYFWIPAFAGMTCCRSVPDPCFREEVGNDRKYSALHN